MSAGLTTISILTGASGATAQTPPPGHPPLTPRAAASHEATALAPELAGLGTLHMAVTTRNGRAQAFFDQGLRLLYAFNHAESRRAFAEAARLDEALAMAYWGQAMALAVNLNAPMSAENGRLAYHAARRGRALATAVTPVERALLDALVTRFAADGGAPRPPLDRAYAEAMAQAAARFPEHPDVQVLAADARMNTMAWDYWQPDGSFKADADTIRRSLEQVIARHPDHPGAHHYYIHLVEGSRQPELAEASADRLASLMPAAGHMVHMPAHIYLRVGRYADAAEANVRAIAADEDYLAQCQAQGLYPLAYYPHNLHFLWAAATFEGRSAAAIAAAREVADKVPHHHAGAVTWTADFPVTPWLAYVRFGRWPQMLTEPPPPVHEPYATGIWHYGRSLGFLARGDHDRARTERAALAATLEHEAFRTTLKGTPLVSSLQIALAVVDGELAASTGHYDEAIARLRDAAAIEDALPYNEPPIWHQPTRHVLGAILLAAGRPADAETAYRQDLERFRENGWSLFGLQQALVAQGRQVEATVIGERFARAWARADIVLPSSRVLTSNGHGAQSSPGTDRGITERIAQQAANVAEGDAVPQFIDLATGVRLEFMESGSSEGTPVIFLHGVTDSWRSFEPVLPYLPRSIHAFVLSQRGHGNSSRPEHGYRFDDFAADLRAFMDARSLSSAIIVGHSMGSLVAQRFAANHPDRVSGLVLAGAFATLYRDPGLTDFYGSQVAPLRDPIESGFIREWQLSTVASELAPELLATVISETAKVPAHVWHEAFQGFLQTPDFSADLARLTAPTLIVWGDRDQYSNAAAQARLREALPHARFVTYEGIGHAIHWEAAERFAQQLTAFVHERR